MTLLDSSRFPLRVFSASLALLIQLYDFMTASPLILNFKYILQESGRRPSIERSTSLDSRTKPEEQGSPRTMHRQVSLPPELDRPWPKPQGICYFYHNTLLVLQNRSELKQ